MGMGSVEGQGGAVKRGGEGNNRGREYSIFDASRALEIAQVSHILSREISGKGIYRVAEGW